MSNESDTIKLAFADFRRSIIRCIIIANAVQAVLLITLMLLVNRPT